MRLFQLAVLLPMFFLIFGCCSSYKNMVLVKGGKFMMGDKEYDEAVPYHEVKISSFNIGVYEVTQAEWESVMGTNPSNFKGDKLPVENISWYKAIDFCNKLSESEGLEKCYIKTTEKDSANIKRNDEMKVVVTCNMEADGYRLPTEAEWEYAARGGRKSKGYCYSGSNDLKEVGWYIRNSGNEILPDSIRIYEYEFVKKAGCSSKEVGKLKPNELGIYDMSGNVYELCWDNKDYYYTSYQVDLEDPMFGKELWIPRRVCRGGSWYYDSYNSLIIDRVAMAPYSSWRDQGLRVVRKVKCFFK